MSARKVKQGFLPRAPASPEAVTSGTSTCSLTRLPAWFYKLESWEGGNALKSARPLVLYFAHDHVISLGVCLHIFSHINISLTFDIHEQSRDAAVHGRLFLF